MTLNNALLVRVLGVLYHPPEQVTHEAPSAKAQVMPNLVTLLVRILHT